MSVSNLIRRLALARNLDPAAVLSVAAGEGGLVNREGDVGDLAGGGSYGPFQLYTQGALPAQYRGRPQAADQWAWSPQGIGYALDKMVQSGARGLRGRDAVDTIIRKFERPEKPDASVAKAWGRYGDYGGGSAQGSSLLANALPVVEQTTTPSALQYTQTLKPVKSNFQNLALGLAQGKDIYGLISQLGRPAPTPRATPAPQGLTTAPVASTGVPTVQVAGVTAKVAKSDYWKWVKAAPKVAGPSASHKPVTLQFVGKIGSILGERLTPTPNESHSLTTTSGNRSQHADGDAADIPATGARLVAMGRAALVAAGADPAWANKQTGGLFNINGKQVIFATNQGGNHFDHVHVGL